MMFTDSRCRNGWLHRFTIIGQYEQGIQERCGICGRKEFFRAYNGKVDNRKYLAFHMRQALPKVHRLYDREYER